MAAGDALWVGTYGGVARGKRVGDDWRFHAITEARGLANDNVAAVQIDRALRAAPHAYLVKPISGDQLIPMVRSALAAAEADQRQQARMQGALDDSRAISAAVAKTVRELGIMV